MAVATTLFNCPSSARSEEPLSSINQITPLWGHFFNPRSNSAILFIIKPTFQFNKIHLVYILWTIKYVITET